MARLYGLFYRLLRRSSFFRGIGRLTLFSLGSRPLLRMVEQVDPDIVVSTYPAVTCVLGGLRRSKRLRIPVVATITDLDGLCFWVHPGADLHLVMHESCIEQVERLAGPGSARQARPLIAPAFHEPRTRAEARRALGLPISGAIAIVSGGGWGVGKLEEATRAALTVDDLSVICLAGRNESVRRHLELVMASEPRVSVWGFTDRMSDLLAAADVLVHATGGVTVLEALARDCPVIAYGAPPGHACLTAKALAKHDLGWMALSPAALTDSLRSVLERPRVPAKAAVSAPSCAGLALAVTPRPASRPAFWPRLLSRAALACVALAMPCLALSTNLPYVLAASPLDLAPLDAVSTSQPEVGLVISAPPSQVPRLEEELRGHHAHASFAFSAPIGHKLLRSIALAQNEPLPALSSGEPMGWLGTRGDLKHLATALGVHESRYYLAPPKLNFGQYLIARRQGALPIRGSDLDPNSLVTPRGFHRGEVIVLDLSAHQASTKITLTALLAAVGRDHLGAVSAGQLLHSASAS